MLNTDVLSQLPIFAGLDEHHLETVARLAFVRAYERGACVFLEGEALPPCFHVLIAGTLQIVKSSHSGKETAIRLIRPGDLFAWAALLDTGVAPVAGLVTVWVSAGSVRMMPSMFCARASACTCVAVAWPGGSRREQAAASTPYSQSAPTNASSS